MHADDMYRLMYLMWANAWYLHEMIDALVWHRYNYFTKAKPCIRHKWMSSLCKSICKDQTEIPLSIRLEGIYASDWKYAWIRIH